METTPYGDDVASISTVEPAPPASAQGGYAVSEELLTALGECPYRMSLPDGRYEHMGEAARVVFGRPAADFLARPGLIGELVADDSRPFFEAAWADLLGGLVPPTYEYQIVHPDGSLHWVLQSNRGVYGPTGAIIAIEGVCRDITEARVSREALQDSHQRLEARLEEKRLLVRELHHRVRNTLQLVSSLLSLQAARLQGSDAAQRLSETASRVVAIAVVQDAASEAGARGRADMQRVLERLTATLVSQRHSPGSRIDVEVRARGPALDMDRAIPCGLLASELVANVLQHAFPERTDGKLVVSYARMADGRLRLEVRDDGVGMPSGKPGQDGGLGLALARSLAHQLGGELELTGEVGCTFSVTFPAPF
jgi:two-component sensor histidine kinase